jgi:hypothetical protein
MISLASYLIAVTLIIGCLCQYENSANGNMQYGSQPICTDYMKQLVNRCYRVYLSNFGIQLPSTYAAYDQSRNNILATNGVNGQSTICRWTQECISCSQAAGAQCVTYQIFQQLFNFTEDDARKFVADAVSGAYICTKGLSVLINNFNCLYNVQTQKSNKINQCLQSMLSNIRPTEEGSSELCMQYNNFINCVMNVYTPRCGTVTNGFICTAYVKGFMAADPTCASMMMSCPN